jgi:flagellar hook assembly protein FlgD
MSFAIARSGDDAQIGVYDISGRLQKTLVSGTLEAGLHTVGWDGTDVGGTPVHAGVYFIRGRVSGNRIASQIIVVR